MYACNYVYVVINMLCSLYMYFLKYENKGEKSHPLSLTCKISKNTINNKMILNI